MGIGGNININSEFGNEKAKATNTPYIAPEAPTKLVLYTEYADASLP